MRILGRGRAHARPGLEVWVGPHVDNLVQRADLRVPKSRAARSTFACAHRLHRSAAPPRRDCGASVDTCGTRRASSLLGWGFSARVHRSRSRHQSYSTAPARLIQCRLNGHHQPAGTPIAPRRLRTGSARSASRCVAGRRAEWASQLPIDTLCSVHSSATGMWQRITCPDVPRRPGAAACRTRNPRVAGTAGGEPAALGADRRGVKRVLQAEPRLRDGGIRHRDRGQKRLRVRVVRRCEHLLRRSLLNDLAAGTSPPPGAPGDAPR